GGGEGGRRPPAHPRAARRVRPARPRFPGAAVTPPPGPVPLLFPDIEASTRLVRGRGSAWPALLEEHHRLLRKAFGRYRGAEVGVEGDGFFVAFDDPGCAVARAGAAQHSLATLEGVRTRIDMPPRS